MSGVETVIGLVLGALPLAISSCEHWRDVAEKYDRVSNFKKHFINLYKHLYREQIVFRLQLTTLLLPLVNNEVIEEDDIERLIDDSRDPLWTDPNVSQAIRARLGKAYEGYFQALKDTEQDCLELLTSLNFDKPEIVNTRKVPAYPEHSLIVFLHLARQNL